MKNILVLTDFSIRAGYAAEFAIQIAIKSQANLILCHAMELTTKVSNGIEMNWPIADHLDLKNEASLDLKELGKKLQKLIEEERGSFKPVIKFNMDFGHLAEVAEKVINEKSIDLVVIGSHKSNGLARFLFGSHTHTVLDKLNCPVLLVPESTQFKGVNTIVYATDLTFNNNKVIGYLSELAKPFNAAISVNHISPLGFPVTKYEQSVGVSIDSALPSDHSPVFYTNIKGDNIKKSLLELTGSGKVDMVALVHKRYDFFEHLFHSSISKQMADTARVPLLVLPHSYSLDIVGIDNDELEHFCYDPGNPSR